MYTTLAKYAYLRGIALSDRYSEHAKELTKQADRFELVTPLQEHQIRVAERIKDVPGLVLYHGLGSGKTLSSLAIANKLNTPTTVVTPASLMDNYSKEIKKHIGGNILFPEEAGFEIKSMQGMARDPEEITHLEPRSLIIDEAHRLRNPRSKGYQAIANHPFDKRILLSGSPIYNDPADLFSLVNLASGQNLLPNTYKDFIHGYIDPVTEEIRNKDYLKSVLRKYVDYFQPTDMSNYPTRKDEIVNIPMTPEQENLYNYYYAKLPGNLREEIKTGLPATKVNNYFLSSTRQLSNTLDAFNQQVNSPKIRKVVEDIQQSPGKTVTYSNYLSSGLLPVAQELDSKKIPYALFTGELTAAEKRKVMEDYNNDKIRALLVSSSGAEGLDLKGTRQVQIMEPHFNDEKINQVIGRGIRYKSHSNLPQDQRNVLVKKYVSTLPSGGKSTDEYLTHMSKKKDEMNKLVEDMLHD